MLAALPIARAPAANGRWIPGDLHVHTTFSRNVCPIGGSCDPTLTGSTPRQQITEAELRGLSFIAFTDHDSPAASGGQSAQQDPEVIAYKQCHALTPDTCPVFVLDGVEKTFVDSSGYPTGQAGAVGYTGPFPSDPTPGAPGWTSSDVGTAAAQVRSAGGLVFAFAPRNPPFTYDPVAVPLDGYEIWNGLWPDQSEILGGTAADNPRADDEWQRAATTLAATGKRLPLAGGSDAHWRRDSAAQGPGQPTMWVFDALDAGPVTWPGIRDGLSKGHAFISNDVPARGARLYLETTTGGLIAGDAVPRATPSNRTVRIRWENAPPGAVIRLFGSNGLSPASFVETGPRVTVTCDAPSDSDAAKLAAWRCNGFLEDITLQFAPASRWYRAQMYVEDAAASQPGILADVPSRGSLPCLPIALAPGGSPCIRDRYVMLAITNPLYSSP